MRFLLSEVPLYAQFVTRSNGSNVIPRRALPALGPGTVMAYPYPGTVGVRKKRGRVGIWALRANKGLELHKVDAFT